MANTSKDIICGLIGNLFIPVPETITAENIHFWNVTEGWLQAIVELREAVTNFQHYLPPTSIQTIVAILVQLDELYNILIEARKTLNARTTIETWLTRLKFQTPIGQLINGFLNLPRPIPPTVSVLPPALLINTFPLPCFEGPLAKFLSKGLQIDTHTKQQCFPICPERKKIYNAVLNKIIKFTQAFGTPLNPPSYIDFQWINIWETLRQKVSESNFPISPLQQQSINAQFGRFLSYAPSQRSESVTLLFLFACSERSALDLTTFLTLLLPAEEVQTKEQDIKQKRQEMRSLGQLSRQTQGIRPSLKNPQKEQQNFEVQQLLTLISQTQIGLSNIIENLKNDFSGGAMQDDQILLAANFKRFMDIDTSILTY